MKTLRFIGMAIVAIIMSVNFAACSDDDEEGNNGNNPLVGTWIDDDGSYEAIIWNLMQMEQELNNLLREVNLPIHTHLLILMMLRLPF